jgi:hypothetical protein
LEFAVDVGLKNSVWFFAWSVHVHFDLQSGKYEENLARCR